MTSANLFVETTNVFLLIMMFDLKTVEDALLSASPTRITELLANGLEEEQKRQIDKQEKQETTPRLTQSLSGFKKLLGQGSDSDF